MSPFHSVHMTCYSSFTETVCLPLIVLEILTMSTTKLNETISKASCQEFVCSRIGSFVLIGYHDVLFVTGTVFFCSGLVQ